MARIASHYGDDPARIEAGRLALAQAVLSVSSKGARDAEVLKGTALQVMEWKYGV